jgi:hypothetical protein
MTHPGISQAMDEFVPTCRLLLQPALRRCSAVLPPSGQPGAQHKAAGTRWMRGGGGVKATRLGVETWTCFKHFLILRVAYEARHCILLTAALFVQQTVSSYFLPFMEPEDASPCLQQPAIGSHPEPFDHIQHFNILSSTSRSPKMCLPLKVFNRSFVCIFVSHACYMPLLYHHSSLNRFRNIRCTVRNILVSVVLILVRIMWSDIWHGDVHVKSHVTIGQYASCSPRVALKFRTSVRNSDSKYSISDSTRQMFPVAATAFPCSRQR